LVQNVIFFGLGYWGQTILLAILKSMEKHIVVLKLSLVSLISVVLTKAAAQISAPTYSSAAEANKALREAKARAEKQAQTDAAWVKSMNAPPNNVSPDRGTWFEPQNNAGFIKTGGEPPKAPVQVSQPKVKASSPTPKSPTAIQRGSPAVITQPDSPAATTQQQSPAAKNVAPKPQMKTQKMKKNSSLVYRSCDYETYSEPLNSSADSKVVQRPFVQVLEVPGCGDAQRTLCVGRAKCLVFSKEFAREIYRQQNGMSKVIGDDFLLSFDLNNPNDQKSVGAEWVSRNVNCFANPDGSCPSAEACRLDNSLSTSWQSSYQKAKSKSARSDDSAAVQ
jgi:hypothetical protein